MAEHSFHQIGALEVEAGCLGIEGTVRASFGLYNTKEEIIMWKSVM